jgi:hypothetical protein
VSDTLFTVLFFVGGFVFTVGSYYFFVWIGLFVPPKEPRPWTEEDEQQLHDAQVRYYLSVFMADTWNKRK